MKSHKVQYRTGNRPVFITGIGVVGNKLVAPNSLNIKIKELWESFHSAETLEEADSCIQALLTNLGTLRYIAGPRSLTGKKASNEMNSLRQKRAKILRLKVERKQNQQGLIESTAIASADAPF